MCMIVYVYVYMCVYLCMDAPDVQTAASVKMALDPIGPSLKSVEVLGLKSSPRTATSRLPKAGVPGNPTLA